MISTFVLYMYVNKQVNKLMVQNFYGLVFEKHEGQNKNKTMFVCTQLRIQGGCDEDFRRRPMNPF
jgi:hypothetical protein